jgi:hypothetical protein
MTALDDATNPNFRKHLLTNHSSDEEWLKALFADLGYPLEPYGYEYKYRNDVDRYNEIKNSDDYITRYRPDFLTEIAGEPYLIELKSKWGWLQAIALMLNAQRGIRVFYIVARQHTAWAEDLVQQQKDYFEFLRFYKRKEYPSSWVKKLILNFHQLRLQEVDYPIGWTNKGYVSGDPCVRFKDGAPLVDLEAFLKRIDSR